MTKTRKLEFKVAVSQYGANDELIANKEFPRTRKSALLASIQKWKTIAGYIQLTGRYVENGGLSTCALCQLYLRKGCLKCPVFEKTGQPECEGTPFELYTGTDNPDLALAFAEREVKFLESLL